MSLRIVHKNEKAIRQDQDSEFNRWADQLLAEHREHMRKVAAKKYGVKYIPKNKNNEAV